MRRLALALFSALALAACAPSVLEQRTEVQQLAAAVSFYPQEAGATWEYLPAGASLGEPRLLQTVEGPTVVGGELWIVTREAGLGIDNRWYRQYRPEGVFLQREVRPGQQIVYDPPVQEYPAEAELRVGATWGGDTTATVLYSEATAPEEQRQSYQVEYRYTVVDRRPVTVEAGTYTVFVIDFEARFMDDARNVLETQKLSTWFTPYLGEVKSEHDFYLVATNVPTP